MNRVGFRGVILVRTLVGTGFVGVFLRVVIRVFIFCVGEEWLR